MATSLGVSSKGETMAPAFSADRFLSDSLFPAALGSASLRRARLLLLPAAPQVGVWWGGGETVVVLRPGAVIVTPAASRCGPEPGGNPTPRAVDGGRRRGGGGERPGQGRRRGSRAGGARSPTQPPAPHLPDCSLRAAKPPGAVSRLQEGSWRCCAPSRGA